MKIGIIAALCATCCSVLFCILLIPILRKMKAGQNILSYVSEHQSKSGTPTMGGLAFIFAAILISIVCTRQPNRGYMVALAVGVAYLCVGFLDDFLKRRHNENMGLRAYQKFAFQTAIAIAVSIFAYRTHCTKLHIPFFNVTLDLGMWCIPFYVFFFLATVNAVNLTDGLDGLAAGVCIPFFLCIAMILILQDAPSAWITLSFSLLGALLGYLPFNVYPAKVFMGDTGSLALGGFIACICALTGNALYVAVIGLPFVVTVLSVVIQVVYYKLSGGKRVFLMAPLHHHLQKRGHSETRIGCVYGFTATVLGGICILCLL